MNYEQFHTIWHEALAQAGLMSVPPPKPSETIDLAWLSRTYRINVRPGHSQPKDSFSVSASLGWQWDALQDARGTFREEEILTELMGRAASNLNTVPPWLRIDVTLRGSLPFDSPIPIPDPARWQRWTAEVIDRLGSLLPIESDMNEHGLKVLSSQSEPKAHLRCNPEGRLFLSGVELSAWQSVDLPRNWDPDRPLDPDPDKQLFDFADWVRQALQTCEQWLPCRIYFQLEPRPSYLLKRPF
jgi:hypothetical protein